MPPTVQHCAILLDTSSNDISLQVDCADTTIAYSAAETALIATLWQTEYQRQLERGNLLFNGKLLRLDHWQRQGDTLYLNLSTTDYKTYVATRQPEFRATFPAALLADPLAICIALITQDNYLLLEQRQTGDVYAGFYHVIGGFMDKDLDVIAGSADPRAAIAREVLEELNLALDPTQIRLTGLVYDQLTPHPELCFQARIPYTLAQIQQQITATPTLEVSAVVGIANEAQSLQHYVQSTQAQLAVTALGCLLLQGKTAFGSARLGV